jgi:hypothetical protein
MTPDDKTEVFIGSQTRGIYFDGHGNRVTEFGKPIPTDPEPEPKPEETQDGKE